MKLKRSKKWWILPSLLVPLAIATPFIATSCSNEKPLWYFGDNRPANSVKCEVKLTDGKFYTGAITTINEYGLRMGDSSIGDVIIPWANIVYLQII